MNKRKKHWTVRRIEESLLFNATSKRLSDFIVTISWRVWANEFFKALKEMDYD